MTITKKNGEIITEEAQFHKAKNNYYDGITLKRNEDSNDLYINANEISSVVINGKNYLTKNIDNSAFLFETLIEGKLSLYQSNEYNYFLEKESIDIRQIPFNTVGLKNNKRYFKYGNIILFVTNCLAAKETAFNRNHNIDIKLLKEIVATYNSCDLSNDTVFTENELISMQTFDDKIRFGVSAGFSSLIADYSNLGFNNEANHNSAIFGVKLLVYPNKEKNTVFFNLDASYLLGKEQNLSNVLINKTSYIPIQIGINYAFNNISDTFKPYLGANGIYIINQSKLTILSSNSFSEDLTVNNTVGYNFKIGSEIKLLNSDFNFELLYQPKLKFSSDSSSISQNINRNYTVSGVQVMLTYLF
ncbi:porin family protein [Lacinutrix venerupis]|uniref:Outer membrane protein with beta-barrel domain n=1 Tax=Lacinutrix venerupis TaxID=1486034 RepID=A0AAC9LMC9_9FLAO|nr:OmpW family outer membrane protein [Lacinutrix venerupis]APY00779.1 hypothetical protein BWR22_10795 [Lacinutrix venerupis]